MRQGITQEVAYDFNSMIALRGSSYRIIKEPDNDYAWSINVLPDPFEKYRPMIYPTKEFYSLLETHFRNCGLIIAYNNTHSIFWAHASVIEPSGAKSE